MIEKIRDAQLKSVRSAEKSQKVFQKESGSSTKKNGVGSENRGRRMGVKVP